MEQNLKILLRLLSDFTNFVDNRSILFITTLREVFPKILDWHFRIWRQEYALLGKDEKLDEWSSYSEIGRVLESLIQTVESRALIERQSFAFFKYMKEHTSNHKEEYVEVDKERWYYTKNFLESFYYVFFETITDSPDSNTIWKHYFPMEWKITKTNFQDNILSQFSWNEFFKWAQPRIWNPQTEFDKKLNYVSANLFPEVDPIQWSNILIFVFSPEDESRVRSVIERPRNFGFWGRFRVYADSPENEEKVNQLIELEREKEIHKTFELACFLFKHQFSTENLQKYSEELNLLKYKKGSTEEYNRVTLLNIFSKMLEFQNRQQQSSNY